MGLFDALKSFVAAVDGEYDRRVRTASLVKHYDPTGASHHHHGAHEPEHDGHAERLEGEGGARGDLQSSAGPQLHGEPAAHEVTH
ncbi:MAG TPA: hypothetical protein VFZ66_19570 [Herpetosiphonaceae bacterium]